MLEKFFHPASVAVVGASRTPGKVGYDVVKNLADAGFRGGIFPVNPKADEILGYKCYPDIPSIGQPVDLAVIVVPAQLVLGVIEECKAADVRAVVIISAGFKESGPDGAELEKELARRCAQYGIRCIGPNCLGVMCPHENFNASFGATMPPPGNVAFFSQSGALGTAILDVFAGEGYGLSRFVSYGNKADVDESDLIEALGEDERTEVILGYVESINDGTKFMDVAGRVTKVKPVVILKSGRTTAGARAASSHTGSLTGADSAYEAAFRQCGVIRADTVLEFFDFALAFSKRKPPKGNCVAIVSNAGGPGIIATDAIESSLLEMATLSPETESVLASRLPPQSNIHNPIDVLGDAKSDRYRAALDAAVKDVNVHAVLTILTPQTSTEVEATAEALSEVASQTEKPVVASFMGNLSMPKGWRILDRKGVPQFAQPERAVRALEAMYRFHVWKLAARDEAPEFKFDDDAIRTVLSEAASAGMRALGERHARRVIEACGLPLPASALAISESEAVQKAEGTGYPVVMKISSDDILHKSDAGGVRLGLRNKAQVKKAFNEIVANAVAYDPSARIDGVLVQQMVRGGTEVIVGMSRDPQFGPLIMFGLGGVYVELLKDVAFRVAPLTAGQAREMIDGIRASRILKGFRGQEPSDLDAVVDCILRVSQLAVRYPELSECDVNPLVVFPKGKGACAVDARFAIR